MQGAENSQQPIGEARTWAGQGLPLSLAKDIRVLSTLSSRSTHV